MLYPILKRQSQSISLGYVASRTLESTVIVIGIVSVLSVVTFFMVFFFAQIVPLVERPTWLPAAQFFSRVLTHPADPGLRDDLAALEPNTLDDL